jgi:hypothetical protein
LKDFCGELGLLNIGQENDGSDERDLQGLLDSSEGWLAGSSNMLRGFYLQLQDQVEKYAGQIGVKVVLGNSLRNARNVFFGFPHGLKAKSVMEAT